MSASPRPAPPPDPLIDEVRARRQELFAACGMNLRVLARRIQELQAQHPELVVDRRRQHIDRPRRT
jgi:hypothetical protein